LPLKDFCLDERQQVFGISSTRTGVATDAGRTMAQGFQIGVVQTLELLRMIVLAVMRFGNALSVVRMAPFKHLYVMPSSLPTMADFQFRRRN